MSDFQVNVTTRNDKGKAVSRRMRHAKQIPAVVYGRGKDSEMLTIDHDAFKHQLEVEAFHNSIIKLVNGGNTQQVILREVQMHPYKPIVMHVDFQRISATDKIHMSIPLHFVGVEKAPGVRLEGGIVSHLMNEVDIICLPGDLPEYLEIDVSALQLNESIHLSEITLPEGVEFTHAPEEEADHAVVSILMPKVAADDLGEEDEEAEERDEVAAEDAQDSEESGEES